MMLNIGWTKLNKITSNLQFIEIIGIPTISNEMCKDTIMNISEILNTVVNVVETYRVPIIMNSENTIIKARLTQTGVKSVIIANYKRKIN